MYRNTQPGQAGKVTSELKPALVRFGYVYSVYAMYHAGPNL